MPNRSATSCWPSPGTLGRAGGGPGLPLEYPENTGGLKKGDVNPPSFRLARFRPEQEFVRTVYLPIIRSGPQAGPAEVRNVFDFTQPGEIAGQRNVTTVPTQSLFLMKLGFSKRRALELAGQAMMRYGEQARLDGSVAPCAEPTDHGRRAGRFRRVSRRGTQPESRW